jgi:two-component system phosphate regulon sensor histidine kinase PhoR
MSYVATSDAHAPIGSFDPVRRILQGLPEPAIILDRSLTVTAFNSRAGDLFQGLREGGHLSSAIRHPAVLAAAVKCGPAHETQTVRLMERIPVERHMAVTVSYVGSPDRDSPWALLFVDDLTEQMRLDELRSDFIANASHEIKTPLASLLGFIETLQGPARNDAEARERFLPIMAQQGQRMARLIDNLMSLSRIEMRAHLKPQQLVRLPELVLRAVDSLEPMSKAANMRIDTDIQVRDAAILGDEDELAQVFINLIHNALKYGREGGRVTVTMSKAVSEGQSRLNVTVEDNGPGIGKQHLPRLTERFYRVPERASLEKGGTGLGLAIVKHVVNRHRGEFHIVSEEGVGSRFTVSFLEVSAPSDEKVN